MIQLPKPEPIDVDFDVICDDFQAVLTKYKLESEEKRGKIIDVEI